MARSAMEFVAIALVAGGLGAGAASAEERPWPPVPGSRIRVTAPGVLHGRVVGEFLAVDGDTLRIQPKGKAEAVVVPRTAITRLELSGRPSRRGKGAMVGLLVGVGAAVAVGAFAGDDCSSGELLLCFDKPTTGLMASVLTIPLGIAFGAALAPGERWETYSEERLRVAIGATRSGGVRGRVALRF